MTRGVGPARTYTIVYPYKLCANRTCAVSTRVPNEEGLCPFCVEAKMACAYCGIRRAVQTDHLITKNQARRSVNAARWRNDPKYKVKSCMECNMAKGTRLRVPVSMAHLIDELEAITGGKYATFSGDLADLHEVVKR